MEQTSIGKTPRVEVVDALRGFAVMAILLVHNIEHFIFPVYPDPSTQYQWLNTLDKGVYSVIFSLFAGKSYAIFALLFGFTFYIQLTNQQRKGGDFSYRFLWRLILLTAFATINAAFFPGGDVLLLFSFTGIFLFIVRKWSNTAVCITAIVFLLQPVEWFRYVASLIDYTYVLPDLGVRAMYGEIAAYTKEGNFWEFILGNITLGQRASFLWAIGSGRLLQTAGLFLLGMLIGRKQCFTSSAINIRFWIKVLIIAAVLYCPIYELKVQLYDNASTPLIKQTVGVVFDMWQKLCFTFVLVPSFMLLYQTTRFRKLTTNLRLYGKMSLTNYISQSIIGALIYFPFSLYLAPYCGFTLSFCIGIIIFVIQLSLCRLYLKDHKQGPLEYLWHKLTWLKF